MENNKTFLHNPYSLAVIPSNSFFECSDGRKGKVMERLPEDKATLVRWSGGQQDYLFWDKIEQLEFRKLR